MSMPTFHMPGVDDLEDLEVAGQAAEHVRVARLEPVALGQQRDHVAHGDPRTLHEVVGDAHRAVVAAGVRARRERPGRRREPGAGGGAVLNVEAQARAHRALDRRHADLAVALRGVRVADREVRAGQVHRDVERRAGREVPRVDVAGALVRRERDERCPRGRGRCPSCRRTARSGSRRRARASSSSRPRRSNVRTKPSGKSSGSRPSSGRITHQPQSPASSERISTDERVAGLRTLDVDRARRGCRACRSRTRTASNVAPSCTWRSPAMSRSKCTTSPGAMVERRRELAIPGVVVDGRVEDVLGHARLLRQWVIEARQCARLGDPGREHLLGRHAAYERMLRVGLAPAASRGAPGCAVRARPANRRRPPRADPSTRRRRRGCA